MNKKSIKKISLLLIIFEIFAVLFCITQSFAIQRIDTSIVIDPNKAREVEDIGNKIFGLVRIIGVFASVIVLMIVGIQYMYATAEEKAEKKKGLIYYVVGAALTLGIINITQFVYDTVNDFIG